MNNSKTTVVDSFKVDGDAIFIVIGGSTQLEEEYLKFEDVWFLC